MKIEFKVAKRFDHASNLKRLKSNPRIFSVWEKPLVKICSEFLFVWKIQQTVPTIPQIVFTIEIKHLPWIFGDVQFFSIDGPRFVKQLDSDELWPSK